MSLTARQFDYVARLVRREAAIVLAPGKEPYSIAMSLHERLPAGQGFRILASDVSAAMVARAAAGRFSQLEINRGLPATLLVAHFARAGLDWQASELLRRDISFRRLNLAAPLPALAADRRPARRDRRAGVGRVRRPGRRRPAGHRC